MTASVGHVLTALSTVGSALSLGASCAPYTRRLLFLAAMASAALVCFPPRRLPFSFASSAFPPSAPPSHTIFLPLTLLSSHAMELLATLAKASQAV